LGLWGIGRSESDRDEHPTIPGPAECTNAHAEQRSVYEIAA
jgi:hypothetical protein